MSKSRVFVGICLAFALGIFLASAIFLDLRLIYILAGLFGIMFAFAFYRSAGNIYWPALFMFFICLGAARFVQVQDFNGYGEWFEQKVKWEGYVVEDPDVRADKQLITVKPKNFNQRILITTTKAQEFFYGDWIVFEGKLKEAKVFEGFDYPGYLERFNVYAVMSYPKVLILKNSQGNKLKFFLLKTKAAFAARLQQFLPEPENSLALGILIGARRGLPADVVENFNLTGTSHIVAVSGFNIAVIVSALSFLAWVAGRRASFWLSLGIILGFVVIAGASASVIRAAVMGGLLLMAFNIGRPYSVIPALVFAAAAMLFVNPKILYWDIGFQLSFAATVGIVLFTPLFQNFTENWPKLFGLKNIFLVTLAATISTLPLVIWYFGRLSVVSLMANLLILPAVPLAMLFGFLAVLPFAAPGFAFLSNLLLSYILWVAEKFARLPFASFSVEISPVIFGLMLLLLVGFYLILRKASGRKSPVLDADKSLW